MVKWGHSSLGGCGLGQLSAADRVEWTGSAAKLLITLGVSGAVQFTAGITGAETIVAIDQDDQAPIFKVCHYGLVGSP